MASYLGIDIGTSGTKTLAVHEDGRILASAVAGYPLSHPHPGWSEQNPEDWWQATVQSVGKVSGIEEKEVAGVKLELFIIEFEKDKMTLRVPVNKSKTVGMRKLSSPEVVNGALNTLKGRARIKRTMWSRRAQEYEAKINSGDIVAIAEVVRDLYRSDTQPEQSYSERQLYEAALDRLSREIAAVQKVTETEAIKEIEGALAKGPRRGPKPADEAGAEEGVEDEAA